MPFSDQENNDWFMRTIEDLHPVTMLDLGPGAGKYGNLAKEVNPAIHTTAVEIWAPYIRQFDLEDIYNKVWVSDARCWHDFEYDLVVAGDILEHMQRKEAVRLWEKISRQAKAAFISIPVVHYPQGEYMGNPFEAHIEDHWTHEQVLESFRHIIVSKEFSSTASYLAVFR